MKTLRVLPNVGIGLLELGMSPNQILAAIKTECYDLIVPSKDIEISEDKEDDGYTLRYITGSFFFMVRYRKDTAIEISVDRELSKIMTIALYDVDVFNTPAEDVVDYVKQFSKCNYDAEDEQLSTNYEFDDIGVRFWREEPFHKKLLSDKAYMEEMSLVIEDMYRYLYFDIVTVSLHK